MNGKNIVPSDNLPIILLVGINARWTHSNLALYYLRTFCNETNYTFKIKEFTIKQHFDDILAEIFTIKPSVIALSVYIWNVNHVIVLLPEIKKVLPDVKIILGGPEVSYNAKIWIKRFPIIDFIICGNGERGFKYLLDNDFIVNDPIISLPNPSFDQIPFPYLPEDRENLKNKYIYYEASRGCPFRCSYCLSSRYDQKPDYRTLDKIKAELKFLISLKPNIIKFIDRTFNAIPDFALSIWKFITTTNTCTKFHFEIHPLLLREQDIEFLSTIPENLFQFEIGIQSCNPQTLKEINRNTDIESALKNITALLAKTKIHIHLDLIAGLPYENLSSFANSFEKIYSLKPHTLQLGFLKVLPGTEMEENKHNYNLTYLSSAPYTILQNKWLNYKEIIFLHRFEKIFNFFYNSHNFDTTITELEVLYPSSYHLYRSITQFREEYYKEDPFGLWQKNALFLLNFIKEIHPNDSIFLLDCLRWDWCFLSKSHFYPKFLNTPELSQLKRIIFQKIRDKKNISGEIDDNSIFKQAIFFYAYSEHFREVYLNNSETAAVINRNSHLILLDKLL